MLQPAVDTRCQRVRLKSLTIMRLYCGDVGWHRSCDPTAMQSIDFRPYQQWYEAREQLRRKFSGLSEDDLQLIPGREESLLENVARKTGRSRQEVVDAFDSVGMFRPL